MTVLGQIAFVLSFTSVLLSCGVEPGPDRYRAAAYPFESIRIGRDGTQARAVSMSVRQPSSAFSERAPRC